MMKDGTVLTTGILGTVIVAICCFTPALVILMGVVGLTAWLAWLDYVLLPMLALCLGVAIYGLILWQRHKKERC
jgi:mercuric ion transport protein